MAEQIISTRNITRPLLVLFLTISLVPLSACSSRKAHLPGKHDEIGLASYYNDKYHGRKTASGTVYDRDKMTVAHPRLPFGTVVDVTNLANGKMVTVLVNDRGPFVKGRIIDLSRAAGEKIDMIHEGLVEVGIRYSNK